MKPLRSRILPLACLSAAILSGVASAQTTATTTPVGFVTVTIPAAVNSTTPSNAAISVPLYGTAAFQGTIASVDSSNAFSLSGAAFTASQYSSSTSPYFVRIMSGTSVGRFFLISANTATQLTVNTSGADLTTLLSVGDSAQIVPANTLGSLFGSTAPGFLTAASAIGADNVYLWNGTTWELYFNNGTHWLKSGNLNPNLDSTIIYPDEGIFISRHDTSGPLTITLMGTVPSTTEQSELAGAGSSFLPNRFPLDTQLVNLGLQNSPNWKAGASASQADNVYVWNTANSTWEVYFYTGAHWQKSGNLNPNLDATVISAGTSVFVTRSSASQTLLSQSLPYTP